MADQTEKELEQQLLLDGQFEVGILDDADLEPFLPLLLPEVAEALGRGDPLIVMGLVMDQVACGCLAGYILGDCFYIESFYVAPAYRRKGGGSFMINRLTELIESTPEIGSMALTFTVAQPDNEPLLPFLEKKKFILEPDNGYNVYLFKLGDLKDVDPGQISRQCSGGEIRAFSQLSDEMLRAAQKRSVSLGTPHPQQMLTSKEIERDLSFALVKDGRIEAYAAMDHSCCDVLTLSALWIGDASRTTLNALLKTVIVYAKKSYPPETPAALQAVNEQSHRLMQRLLPQAKKVSYSYRRVVW